MARFDNARVSAIDSVIHQLLVADAFWCYASMTIASCTRSQNTTESETPV